MTGPREIAHRATGPVARRLLTVLLIAVAASLVGIAPASAHSELISSNPADGSSTQSSPEAVVLTFSEPVQDGFTTVTVLGPDGNQWQAGPPAQQGPQVTAPVRPLGPPGEYTIGYRVLSADSHPVTGSVRFTLTEPGPGAAAPAAPSGTAAEPSGTTAEPSAAPGGPPAATDAGGGGTPIWPWIAGAVVLLAVGVGAALRLGRS